MNNNNSNIVDKLNEVSPPFFTGGSGYFTIRPINAHVYFWAANKHGSENNTHPYFEDSDVQNAKDKADKICTALNNYDSLLQALNECKDYFDYMGGANHHASREARNKTYEAIKKAEQ